MFEQSNSNVEFRKKALKKFIKSHTAAICVVHGDCFWISTQNVVIKAYDDIAIPEVKALASIAKNHKQQIQLRRHMEMLAHAAQNKNGTLARIQDVYDEAFKRRQQYISFGASDTLYDVRKLKRAYDVISYEPQVAYISKYIYEVNPGHPDEYLLISTYNGQMLLKQASAKPEVRIK